MGAFQTAVAPRSDPWANDVVNDEVWNARPRHGRPAWQPPPCDLGQRPPTPWVVDEDPPKITDKQRQADRGAARLDLESRFVVVDKPDPAVPNQVTRADFESICDMYSDIRLGDSKIDFNPTIADAADFKRGALDDIAAILQTPSGRELIQALAYETEDDGSFKTLVLGSAAAPDQAAASVSKADREAGNSENGVGADVRLRYVPGAEVLTGGAGDAWSHTRSDAILFHEMVHALHIMRGDKTPGDEQVGESEYIWNDAQDKILRKEIKHKAAAPADVGVDADEYQAVGLGRYAGDKLTENSYRRERLALAGKEGAQGGDELMARRERYTKGK